MGQYGSYPPITAADLDADDLALLLRDGVISRIEVSELAFGLSLLAVPDVDPTGTVDSAPAIQAALTTIEGSGEPAGGTVWLPRGILRLDSQIEIPNKCRLVGAGRQSTYLRAHASFPTSTAVVRLGRSTDTFSFDSRLEYLTVDCNGVTGSKGVWSTTGQEGTGLFCVQIIKFDNIGYHLDGTGAANTVNYDLGVSSASGYNPQYGVYVDGGAKHVIDTLSITMDGVGSPANNSCVYLNSTHMIGSNWHLEDAVDGVTINANGVSGCVVGVDSSAGALPCTTLIHYNGGAVNLNFLAVQKNSCTNIVKNDFYGITRTDSSLASTLQLDATPNDFRNRTLVGDQSSTSTSLADVSNLNDFPTQAGRTYRFEFDLIIQTAATTTGGLVTVNHSTAVTSIVGSIELPTSATTWDLQPMSGLDGGTQVTSGPGTTSTRARLVGQFVVNTAGTFALRFKTEVGGSAFTIKAGSSGYIRVVE